MKEEQKGKPWTAELLRLLVLVLVLALALGGMWPRASAAETAGTAPVLELGTRSTEQLRSAVTQIGDKVIPLGRAVGIKMFSDGVMVVGLSDIPTAEGNCCPAGTGGLREGDIITHINGEEVESIEQVQSILQDLAGAKMSVRALRGEKQFQVTAAAVKCSTDGSYKLGAWIRDSMAGIGTMTFYDPSSGAFGALGHGINDVDTALLMPLQSGSIMYAEVTDVQKGTSGAPGELHGAFQVTRDMGELYANTERGIFGVLTDESLAAGVQPVEVAQRREVKTGPATVLSNVAGDKVEEYAVEITRIYPAGTGDTRNMMIKVTDPRLIEATGGIVQGMSGSPILQNGKLIGAVTHVLVNDSTQGYAILAENMLSQAVTEAQERAS